MCASLAPLPLDPLRIHLWFTSSSFYFAFFLNFKAICNLLVIVPRQGILSEVANGRFYHKQESILVGCVPTTFLVSEGGLPSGGSAQPPAGRRAPGGRAPLLEADPLWTEWQTRVRNITLPQNSFVGVNNKFRETLQVNFWEDTRPTAVYDLYQLMMCHLFLIIIWK